MSNNFDGTGLQLRSLIKASGELELSLQRVPVAEPGPDEVVVRIEASPINPSDLGLLVGAADMSTAKSSGSGESTVVAAFIAHGHGLIHPARHGPHERGWHSGGDDGGFA